MRENRRTPVHAPHARWLQERPGAARRHKLVTDAVHAEGGKIAMQILHAGRYGYHPLSVSASKIKSPITPFRPRELSRGGVENTIEDFVRTAAYAQEAGYDGVEVMGSEGYLINQFLVKRTNQRTDEWGGSYENRMRFPTEIVRRIRAKVGRDFIIVYRLSMLDLVEDGQTWEEIVQLAKAIEAAGATLINTGIGWHEARSPTIATSVPRAAFAHLTAKLRPEVSIPVITSNRINTPEVAEDLLATGAADMVSMARPWLADADFIAKAAAGRARDIAPCIACHQACLDHTFSRKLTSCLVNPRACHETELEILPATAAKSIVVVGAGPAGMAASITAAQRGHKVTLYDAASRPGGQLHLAASIPGKEEFRGLIDWIACQPDHPNITLRLGETATEEKLKAQDEVILATGVTPRDPGIPTEAGANVLSYIDVLQGASVGPRVAIIGAGGIGFDVAEYLVHQGDSPTEHPELWRREWGVSTPWQARGGLTDPQPEKPARQVWLLQRKAEKPGRRLGKTTGWIHRATLAAKGVKMIGGVNYEAITTTGLQVSHGPDRLGAEEIAVDAVILCSGQEPSRGLSERLISAGIPHHLIGGADVAAELDAKRAIDQAVRLAARL